MADTRLSRPRAVQGHPDRRQGRTGRNGPALQGCCRRLDGAHRFSDGGVRHRCPARRGAPTVSSRDYAVVHYQRADGDYADWGLYAWGDLADGESTTWPDSHPFTGRDAYGAFAYVKLKPGASNVAFLVIDKDGDKDVSADRTIDVTRTGEVWIEQGKDAVQTQRPDYPAQDRTKAVLHYHRADGNYAGFGVCTPGRVPRTPRTGRGHWSR